jgi:uncharacterized membrane protein YdbT with pleckstrin-like domain
MSRDLEERLLPGESIIAQAVIHDGIYWKSVAVFIIALLFALFVFVELGVILALFGLGMVTTAILKKEILMLVVTNNRVFVRYGILQVDVVDIHFDKVESVELERMLPGYLMGYSNVIIMGTGNRFIVIPYVANGIEIRRAYNEQTLLAKNAQAAAMAAAQPATTPAPAVHPSPGKKEAKSADDILKKEGAVKGSNFVMKD